MVLHQSTTPCTERDAFGHWLSGFVDGEGCFLLQVRKEARRPFGSARFNLGIRRDDRDILEQMQTFWSVGFISNLHRVKGNENPAIAFQVCRIEHLKSIIVPHFEAYPLRAKKRKDFDIWKQGVDLCHEVWCRPIILKPGGMKGHQDRWRQDDIDRFVILHDALRKQRIYEAEDVILPPRESPRETQLGLFG